MFPTLHGILSQLGYSYLLRDKFTTTESAPMTTPRTAEPGPGTLVITDTESIISVDNGGLRIKDATTAGWQRHGISAALTRSSGLAIVFRFMDGDVQTSGEHISVGVFTSDSPADPTADGYAIVIEGNGTKAGRLLVNLATDANGLFQSIKQVEMLFVVVLRSSGAAYYISAPDNARGVGSSDYPALRPLGINPGGSAAGIYPSLWQYDGTGALTSTRLFDLAAYQAKIWNQWYGTAQSADNLSGGSGSINGVTADIGGAWTLQSGTMGLDATGAKASAAALATLPCADTCGLIKITAQTGSPVGWVILAFRFQDSSNYWWFGATSNQVTLRRTVGGVDTTVASSGVPFLVANATNTLQVVDDGNEIHCFLNGTEVPGSGGYTSTILASATGVGIRFISSANVWVTDIEAHARNIALPVPIKFALFNPSGSTTVATDDFTGATADLLAKTTTTGDLVWGRENGSGNITYGGGQAEIDAANTTDALYILPWSSNDFCDAQLNVTPPGAAYGSGDVCRTGILFYQDTDYWLAVRLFVDDAQTNASEIEVVLNYAGEAVVQRVNFGTEIAHGVSKTLQAVFNGDKWLVRRAGESVMSGAITNVSASYAAISIDSVGIYAGSVDTGSVVSNFVAKGL